MKEAPPFSPQPIETMRRRFLSAFDKVWDVETIERDGHADRPGLCPENIFDFSEGVRLVASRMELPDATQECVVSASYSQGSNLAKLGDPATFDTAQKVAMASVLFTSFLWQLHRMPVRFIHCIGRVFYFTFNFQDLRDDQTVHDNCQGR